MNEFEKAERATEQAEKLSDYDFLMLYAKTMERRGKPGDAYLAARVASICSRLPANFRAAAPAAAEPEVKPLRRHLAADEIPASFCGKTDCNEPRIRGSAYCRVHTSAS